MTIRLAGWLLVFALAAATWLGLSRGADPGPHPGPWRLALARLQSNGAAQVAVIVLVMLLLAAVLAPLLAPFDPSAQPDIVGLKSRAPSLAHPFGTDSFSRDVFSRVLYGARVSLSVGVLAVLLAVSLGTAYGAVAGYAGGRVDGVMMRILDALLSIPRLLLLIAVLALWGRVTVPLLIVLLGLTGWFGVSRIVRAQVLALREQDFIVSARALGAADWRILARHVLPNVLSPVVVAATLAVGNVIILEAGLSFLGIGVPQPRPSWGNIIHDGSDNVAALWWMSVFPGLMIVVTVMALNTLGDALRDALDPRQVDGP